MSNIVGDLSGYQGANPTDTFDVYLVDGTSHLGVGILEVLDDGLLLFMSPPDIAPRRYIPMAAVSGVQVTGDLSYR